MTHNPNNVSTHLQVSLYRRSSPSDRKDSTNETPGLSFDSDDLLPCLILPVYFTPMVYTYIFLPYNDNNTSHSVNIFLRNSSKIIIMRIRMGISLCMAWWKDGEAGDRTAYLNMFVHSII